MAKQVGPVLFTGTIDGIIFYKLGDKYYSRAKGSYKSAKHMRRNPRYQRTMEKADQFGLASKLAHEVYYYHLPKSVRKHGLYGQLTGLANTALQEGKNKEKVLALLITHCQQLAAAVTPAKQNTTEKSVAAPPTPNTDQPSSVNNPPSSNTTHHPKNPRYLSRWKVKKNGRLQIPATSNIQPPALATTNGRGGKKLETVKQKPKTRIQYVMQLK